MRRRGLFNAEAPLWHGLGRFGEILLLSMMWFLCSVPVVTLGGATAALYDTVVHSLRRGEEDIFSRFWRTLKNETLSAIPATLLWEAILTGLFLLFRMYTAAAGTGRLSYILAVAFLILQVFVLGAAGWVFPLLSRFTLGFGALNRTAVRLAAASPWRTGLLGALLAGAGWLCLRFLLPVMLLPAVAALGASLLLEPVFGKYIKE